MKKYTLILLTLFVSFNTFGQTGLKKGVKAPEFKMTDNAGKVIDLHQLVITHKAVALFFYRGQWCPYCNKYIKQLQDSMSLLTAKGVYVIGITPETGSNIEKTVEKTHASFSIIQDKGGDLMKAYDVIYKVDDGTFAKLSEYGIDLESNNGNKDHMLPVPATYLIDRSGKISYVHFDKDYTKRASVNALLKNL